MYVYINQTKYQMRISEINKFISNDNDAGNKAVTNNDQIFVFLGGTIMYTRKTVDLEDNLREKYVFFINLTYKQQLIYSIVYTHRYIRGVIKK